MKYKQVLEGTTRLKVPDAPGISKREEVFYNPHMRLNRDLTVASCKLHKPESFLDVLAGTGARGIRVANEAGCNCILNDLNPLATALIRENAILNDVQVEVNQLDARSLLASQRHDFVDLDPFGSPVYLMEPAVSAVNLGGVLSVCATDTSALSGTYPKACLRKYDSMPLRSCFYHEIGLRILVGFVARTSLRQNRGIKPLFSHCRRHYMRVQLRIEGKTRKTLDSLGYLQHCLRCGFRDFARLNDITDKCCCTHPLSTAGPLWIREFAEPAFCRRLLDELFSLESLDKSGPVRLVEKVAAEQNVHIPYYDLHKFCRRLKLPPPGLDVLSNVLEENGHRFSRTHFSGTGFRTDATVLQLSEIIQQLGK